jgi:2-dehydro-3-deoxyphosphogluconate aldolase/(4S)-4-hydroxy-2-oxoglutarate aldolase
MMMTEQATTMQELLSLSPVIPVLSIKDASQAVPLARALVSGGLKVIEVTLRTPCALEAMRRIVDEVEGACVGAGTVLTAKDLDLAQGAGARFAVSPGATPALLAAAKSSGLPFLPGVATPSEIMAALEAGLDCLKFFPAEAAGGIAMLKAFSGPFPGVRFCPTGGIREETLASYLALGNVAAVGGTWLAPADLLANNEWGQIQVLAERAVEKSQS